ncbi:MAG: hypothetical protein J6Y16_06895 [Treponema sp.]|nr:hypothetical protein [Treponema sp.]
MEKSAAGIRKFGIGLLVLLFIQIFPLIGIQKADAISWAYIQSLRFKKVENYFYTATDCSFTVNIENVPPEKVTVSVNDVPEGVEFKGSTKIAYMPYSNATSEQFGTTLTISFRFAQKGVYQIKSIDVRIDESYAKIPVEVVEVYENPNTVQPVVTLSFDGPDIQVSGKTVRVKNANSHIIFRMDIQYAIQVLKFNWELPENSLFKQLDYTDLSEEVDAGKFTPEKIPIALFDWQPLKPGKYDFPKFDIVATSYGGIRYEVKSPDYVIEVEEDAEALAADVQDKGVFAYAFVSPPAAEEAVQKKSVEDAPVDRLFDLYTKERHSITLFSSAYHERLALEEELGLSSLKHMPSLPLFILVCVACIASLVATVVLFILKKIPHAALCAVLFVLLVTVGILLGHQVSKKYGIYEGGEIYSIPEDTGGSGVDMPRGSVVLVKHGAAGWLYVVFNDTYGWVPEDTVRMIQ